jgi:NADH-quinone oxidoreductase subunit C/D
LDGERIVKATPDLGYLHRGVEKLSEGLAYMQIIPHTDRLDYVCAMSNNYAYVRAVEKLLEITVPVRAEYIRTIVAEMQRIIGHLFWLGTQALDIGAMTVFFWTFREREVLLDMFEKLCGARLTLNYYRIGGVDSDFTPELVQRMKAFLDTFPEKVKEYDSLIASNRIWLGRTKNVALLSAEDAINFGCTGPVLRGSGSPTMSGRPSPMACTTKSIGKSRSARTATPTTGTGSAWKKCGRAPGSSHNVSISYRRGRSWLTRRNISHRPRNWSCGTWKA